jgi:3-methyl-2-oxobutanoate hydroxymethyltransferase
VLVTHDVLGLFDRFTPRFVEKYADLHKEMARALTSFKEDIERRAFPAPKHTVEMSDDEWERFEQSLGV